MKTNDAPKMLPKTSKNPSYSKLPMPANTPVKSILPKVGK